MRLELARSLQAHGGVVRRGDLIASVPAHVIDRAVSRGQFVRVLPQVYCDPGLLDTPLARLQAALAYAGKNAALSHTSGATAVEPARACRLAGAPHNQHASVGAGR